MNADPGKHLHNSMAAMMENSSAADDSAGEAVCVCVRTRPLSEAELEACCRVVAQKTPGEPQITLGDNKDFTFDEVFPMETQQSEIFDTCIKSMIDGSINGFNQTVLAYGQTGSGKTYTMGTGFDVDLPPDMEGMIPRAVKYLYQRIAEMEDEARANGLPPPEFRVSVSFLELYRKNFYDLLHPNGKTESDVKIRDEKMPDGSFQVKVTNVMEVAVTNVQDLMERLRRGSMSRVTERTDMNNVSSRSHAVFTIFVTHRRVQRGPGGEPGTPVATTSKFNFVDLAGSERLKRTGATGDRAKEGVDINSGLLALGNVISALGDPAKRGSYVPYRDSKLTRMLQDSLGGNSRTLMLACISPCDRDFIETLNTLKYANRARNIRNKVLLNQDSSSKQIQMLHETISRLQREVALLKDGIDPASLGSIDPLEMDQLRHANEVLKRDIVVTQAQVKALEEQLVQSADSSQPRDALHENISLKTQLAAANAAIAELRSTNAGTSVRSSDARPQSAVVSQSRKAVERGRKIMQMYRSSDNAIDDDSESDGADDEEDEIVEGESPSVGAATRSKKPSGDAAASTRTDTKDLVEELGAQIIIQENLLKELASKESEIKTQRQQYEEKLILMTREKEQINAEFNKIKGKLNAVQGSGGDSKKLRQQYKSEMRTLEKRLKQMGEDAKRRDRELQESVRAMDKIAALKHSLNEAKIERKKLLAEAKADAKEARQAESQRHKELIQLKKQHDKTAAVNKVLESDVQMKSALLEKLKRENESVKAKLKAADARADPSAQSEPKVRRSTRLANLAVPGFGRKTRRSVRESMKIARKDIKFFQNEIDAAVEYRTLTTETDELIARREVLAADRKRLRKSLQKASGAVAEELQEELEGVQEEADILTEELQTRQETLLEKQAAGITGYVDPTDVSEKCEDFVSAMSSLEASAIIKEFILMAVSQRLELSKSKQATIDLDIRLREKEALLKSYMSGGRSLNDSQPLANSLAEVRKDIKNFGVSVHPTPSSLGANMTRAGSLKKSSPAGTRKESKRDTPTSPRSDANVYSEPHGIFERGLRGGREPKVKVKEAKNAIVEAPRSGTASKASSLVHTHTITGHDDEVTTVAYNDGILYSGSKDKSVRIWDLNAGELTCSLPIHEYMVKRIVLEGSCFYSASRNSLRIWDTRTNSCSKNVKMKSDINDMTLSDDSNFMFIATDKILRIYDMRRHAQLATFNLRAKLSQVCALQGGSVALSSINNVMILDNVLTASSFEDANPKKLIPPHYDKVLSMATSGSNLFSGSRDYSIKKWDCNLASEWSLGNSITSAHSSYVSAMSVLPGGYSLVSGSAKGDIKLWDANKAELVGEASAHEATINDITSTTDTIFTASSDRTVKIWSYSEGSRNEVTSSAGSEEPVFPLRQLRGMRSEATRTQKKTRRMTYTVESTDDDNDEDSSATPNGVTLDDDVDELNRTITLEKCSFDFGKLRRESDYREDEV